MKNIILMAGTGVGLFVATAVGMLGMQGRLNYEGTRGIPLLSNLFAAPEEPEDPEAEKSQDHAAQSDGGHEPDEQPEVDLLSQSDGIEVIHQKVSIDGDSGGEDGEDGGAHGGGDESEGEKAHGESLHATDRARMQLEPSPRDQWQNQNESARGKPGIFFAFPRMESSLTVEEINEIYRHAKAAQAEVKRRLEDLDGRELRLRQRERDVQDRASTLSETILDIKRMEQNLQDKVNDFNAKVLLVSKSKEQDLRPTADMLASFDPAKAAELVQSYWETESGRLRVSMVLKIMDQEVARSILAEMKVEQIKEIIDNLLKIHRETESDK